VIVLYRQQFLRSGSFFSILKDWSVQLFLGRDICSFPGLFVISRNGYLVRFLPITEPYPQVLLTLCRDTDSGCFWWISRHILIIQRTGTRLPGARVWRAGRMPNRREKTSKKQREKLGDKILDSNVQLCPVFARNRPCSTGVKSVDSPKTYENTVSARTQYCQEFTQKKRDRLSSISFFVPRTGFEPAHPCERCDLNTVRLPISPPGHYWFCSGSANIRENWFLRKSLNVTLLITWLRMNTVGKA
jgi:hypothetical protein